MTKKYALFVLTFLHLCLFTDCNGQAKGKADNQFELTNGVKSAVISNLIDELNSNYVFRIGRGIEINKKIKTSHCNKSIIGEFIYYWAITLTDSKNLGRYNLPV